VPLSRSGFSTAVESVGFDPNGHGIFGSYVARYVEKRVGGGVPGAVNGDGKVDVSDLFDLSNSYGSDPSTPNWDPYCDFNKDNRVEALDLYIFSKNYGKTT
jgi:hypothetical protein